MQPRSVRLGRVPCSTHTVGQLVNEVRYLLENRLSQPRTILCVNAHIYRLAAAEERLRSVLERARIVTADGMGIVLAAPLFGVKINERCNMTEAFRAFLTDPTFPPTRALLFGVSTEEAARASRRIEQISRHCRIEAYMHGFLPEENYVEFCARYPEVDFVFVGMGTPRTEYVTAALARNFPEKIIWGVGAGTLRILAGTMREAPVAWRRAGFQWLYRLLRDPRNLWERYTVGHVQFIWQVLKGRLEGRTGRRPLHPRRREA